MWTRSGAGMHSPAVQPGPQPPSPPRHPGDEPVVDLLRGRDPLAGGPARNAFFPVFLTWLLKTILIRVGGVRLYQEVQPLMIGIMVGYVLGAAVAILADVLYFPGSIHELQVF